MDKDNRMMGRTPMYTRVMTVVVVTAAVWTCVSISLCTGTSSHASMRPHQHSHQHRRSGPSSSSSGGQEALKQYHERHHVPKRPPPMVHNPKMLHDNKLIHDIEHLKEELPNYIPMDKIQEMTEKELDYHYFRMHDKDENLKLDGLELLGAIMHVHSDDDDDEEGEGEGQDGKPDDDMAGLSEEEQKVLRKYRQEKFEESVNFYVELVDDVMEENDRNDDGFLSWTEFLRGRRRDI